MNNGSQRKGETRRSSPKSRSSRNLSEHNQGGFVDPELPTVQGHMRPFEWPLPEVDIRADEKNDCYGRYRILKRVGEGGFGVVYLAEQTEPVRRRVALKVIRHGMATDQFVARFEIERQALALMDHENIARAIDAGTSAMGRPYFVMEFVEGRKITDFCDERQLSIVERLELFIQVCAAVQHAHQKGVIHRDIKPSNILVTMRDGVPTPKIIDFGIAKAVENELTDTPVITLMEQFLGSPAYTSPERLELDSRDVDTRSDIYSLGSVLYELLTGAPPFESSMLIEDGYDRMREIISHSEPSAPSARLDDYTFRRLEIVALRRGGQVSELKPLLRGDLDAITLKALEKDRVRRYPTANGFALDVRRFLSREPVLARKPSALYRLTKTIQRHQTMFVAICLVMTSLVVGSGVAIWQVVEAKEAKEEQVRLSELAESERDRALQAEQAALNQAKLAESEADKSRIMGDLWQGMISGITPTYAKGRDISVLLDRVDDMVGSLQRKLREHPIHEAEMREGITDVYFQMGVMGDRILTNAQRAVALRLEHQGANHPDIGLAYARLAMCYTRMDEEASAAFLPDLDHAISVVRKAGETHEGVLGDLLQFQGGLLKKLGRSKQAISHFREALALRDKGGIQHKVAWTKGTLGALLVRQGDFEEGRRLLAESREMRSGMGKDLPDLTHSLHEQGELHSRTGDFVKASQDFQNAIELGGVSMERSHPAMIRTSKALEQLPKPYRPSPGLEKALWADFHAAKRLAGSSGDPEKLNLAMMKTADRIYSDLRVADPEPLWNEGRLILEAKSKVQDSAGVGLYCQAVALELRSARANEDESRLLEESAKLYALAAESLQHHTNFRIRAIERQSNALARLGRWREAADLLKPLIDSPQLGALYALQLAQLQVWLGEMEGYHRTFEAIKRRWSGARNWFEVALVVRAGVLTPGENVDVAELETLMDVSLSLPRQDEEPTGRQWLYKATVAYRMGEWAVAKDLTWKAIDANPRRISMVASAKALRMMCNWREGRFSDARKGLDHAEMLLEPTWFGKERAVLGENWSDTLFARLLLRETRQMMETATHARN